MSTVLSNTLWALLFVNFAVHLGMFIIGCNGKARHLIKNHETLKTLLIWNRILFHVLLFAWLFAEYRVIWYSSNAFKTILAILLIAIGQSLNVAVYKALGTDGVYYGAGYGVISPTKVSGFPFTLRHPQYIGSIITTLGVFCLFGWNKDGSLRPRTLILALYVCMMYVLAIVDERNGCS